ncbi:MAG: tetratricopeptide repeat protein [candidate division WOR-3 bacterium]
MDMRFKILSQFETEAINFAKSCLEHGNKNDARKILQKVLKIIPDSQEVKGLLDGLMVG